MRKVTYSSTTINDHGPQVSVQPSQGYGQQAAYRSVRHNTHIHMHARKHLFPVGQRVLT